MSRPKTDRVARLIARTLAVGRLRHPACRLLRPLRASRKHSYLDRRETIAQSGGDAVAGNTVNQMVDPWPAYSGDKNIAFNGDKMQQAVARYRTGKEIQPEDPENFMSTNQTGQTISTTVNNAGASPGAAVSTAATP